MSNAENIFNYMKRSYLLDDRREYDVDDLMKAYAIPEDEALELFNLIQGDVKL